MAKNYPDDFAFIPKTWIFPTEYTMFQTYVRELKKRKKSRCFIVKPANGAMGNGFVLKTNHFLIFSKSINLRCRLMKEKENKKKPTDFCFCTLF